MIQFAGHDKWIEVQYIRYTHDPGIQILTRYSHGTLHRSIGCRPRFREAPPPDPESGDGWSEWTALLASRSFNPTDGVESAMTVVTNHGYGTVSSSLVALPALRRTDRQPVWLFAAGRPDLMTYESVSL